MTEVAMKTDIEQTQLDPLLGKILKFRRKHGSVGDIKFRGWLEGELKKLCKSVRVGPAGTLIARTDDKSDTLFSCHVDTVHSQNESNTEQALFYDASFGHLFVHHQETPSSCLGADDGAGIYIMLKMIAANVPGTYLFHTGEECGAIGARAMLDNEFSLLDEFSRSIAFDRPNTNEVIIKQGGMECASREFGNMLAGELNRYGLAYEISDRGVFTDNKIYAGVIPENVNLGVGYFAQHTKDEYLDVNHVEQLLKACLAIKWDDLQATRKPVKQEPRPSFGSWVNNFPKEFKSLSSAPVKPNTQRHLLVDDDLEGFDGFSQKPTGKELEAVYDMSAEDIHDLVETDPYVAAHTIIALLAELDAEKAKAQRYFKLLS
jgi:hypothetical protein